MSHRCTSHTHLAHRVQHGQLPTIQHPATAVRCGALWRLSGGSVQSTQVCSCECMRPLLILLCAQQPHSAML